VSLGLVSCQVRQLNFDLAKGGLGTHLFDKVPRPGDNEVTLSVFVLS